MPQPQPESKSAASAGTLPKEALLLKLLNMTTASEDTVACVAIRKANELLASAGWTWEKLLSGKIVVVEDPFSKIPEVNSDSIRDDLSPPRAPMAPFSPPRPQPQPQAKPSRSATAPPPQPSSLQRPPMPLHSPGVGRFWLFSVIHWDWRSEVDPNYVVPTPKKLGDRENRYQGWCYCCGTEVPANAGFIFQPTDHNASAKHKWEITCAPCNTSGRTISATRAKRKFPDHQANSHVDLRQL